ncbi:hypothetical protein WA158_002742 [Blastocystis sp. Blastoise]
MQFYDLFYSQLVQFVDESIKVNDKFSSFSTQLQNDMVYWKNLTTNNVVDDTSDDLYLISHSIFDANGDPVHIKKEKHYDPNDGKKRKYKFPDGNIATILTPEVLDNTFFHGYYNKSYMSLLANNLLLLLDRITIRGLFSFLGIRTTIGSTDILPPHRETLIKSYNTQRNPKAYLTIGARALCKHAERSKTNYWARDKGNDLIQNELSQYVLQSLFNHCIWINTYILLDGYQIFEIRNSKGYGARWSANGDFFRGFAEPYMENGFEQKWRHD